MPQDKNKYSFSPVKVEKHIIPEKKILIGNSWMTEKDYFDMVEAIRETEFPSMPRGDFQKTALHNRDKETNLFRVDELDFDTEKKDALPFPIIMTETLPF